MNEWLYAGLLGLLQGATEFLPVSSSGHLVLAEAWLPGWHAPGVAFDALLHFGTLLAVLLHYRRDIAALLRGWIAGEAESRDFALAVIVGSVPTAAIGLGFQDTFEALFAAPRAVGGFLLLTAGLLLVARWAWPRAERRVLGWPDALIVGIAQGAAIAPGISRSGSTVTAALLRGIEPEQAARFSFLLSIPAVGGAVLLKIGDGSVAQLAFGPTAVGVVAAFLSGWLAIRLFVRALVVGRFVPFVVYLVPLGLLALTWGGRG